MSFQTVAYIYLSLSGRRRRRHVHEPNRTSAIGQRITASGVVEEGLFEDAGYYVVIVRLRNLGAVEGAGNESFVRAEVVDEDLAVDLGGVQWGAAFP